MRRAPALLALAAVAISACDSGIHLPGSTAQVPTQLTARGEAAGVKGSIYVAQGGRIWKLRGGTVTALTPAGPQYAYPTASASGAVTAASMVSRGQSQIAVGGPDFSGLTPLAAVQRDPHHASLDLKPSLSPDGTRMVFMSDRSACCSDEAVWEGPYPPAP